MAANRPTVSVIFPTLNEAKNLPLIFPHLPMDMIDEVILVDGRSTDDTVEVARRLLPSVKVVLETKQGKGAAMRAGYRAAQGDILAVIDADGSNDPRELPRYIKALVEGADFVKGSRFAHQAGTTDMPRFRQMGNGAFVSMVNTLFGTHFTDLCYGYHAFWRYCLDQIDLSDVDGFEIDTAIYLRAVRQRFRITEVPSFEGYRFYGIGKLQTFPDGWRVLKTIMREWSSGFTTPKAPEYLGFRGTALLSSGNSGLYLPEPAASLSGTDLARSYLQLLYLFSCVLTSESSMRHLLQNTLKLTLEAVGATSGSLLLMDESGRLADGFIFYRGQMHAPVASQLGEAVSQGLAGWVVQNRQPALVTSTLMDPRWHRQPWEKQEGLVRSALGLPLINNDRIAGVLTLVHHQPRQFTEGDLAALAPLATSVLPSAALA